MHQEDETLSNDSLIYWSRRREQQVPVRCGKCGKERWSSIKNAAAYTFTGLCYECSRIAMRKHTDIETLPNGSVIYWNERRSLGRDAEIPVQCGICGQIRTMPAYQIPRSGFTGYCVDCARTGYRSHFWKGGRFRHPSGYFLVRLTPDHPLYDMADDHHLVPEHRLIMAEHIGRPLRDDEIVHHRNGIKDDNRLENLELLARRLHHTGFQSNEHEAEIPNAEIWAEIIKLIKIIISKS